ncbi:alpha/beta fold hydrolase [Bradyrhizobium sp. 2TAF24]|uniref:alpha/beta fold hydrolase n=1 Tax=Bradyrhizobium sp. 2TAF24 TaxID=3233011 RepID=UPI003F929615
MKPDQDDDLAIFAAGGAPALPPASHQDHVAHAGARIWYAAFGTGAPVVLLHGGLGHSGNWGHQVPALIDAGYRVIVIDSRGHGRSTRDGRPYAYELMTSDVIAVMDSLRLDKAAFVGWSDGACIALTLAMAAPARVAGVLFFGCNMDPSGAKPIEALGPVVSRCLERHIKDYAALSATPDQFKAFSEAVSAMMATQPDATATDLAGIDVPVTIVHSELDEFILPEHAAYLARTIPRAELIVLPGVSHFAPLQRPQLFNRVMLDVVSRFA